MIFLGTNAKENMEEEVFVDMMNGIIGIFA